MIRLVVLLLFYLPLIQSAKILEKPMLDGRIVGGQPVNNATALSDVSMRINGAHACGASLITPSWILTAAHCTNAAKSTEVTVRIGSLFKNSGGIVVPVKQIIQHEKINIFDSSGLSLGYLILPLPNEVVAVGTELVVRGWGNTQNIFESSEKLRAVTVPVANQVRCNAVYVGRISPRMICAGEPTGGKDSCQGDSGGALRRGDKIIGIVSFGFECALPLFPGVYASVPALRSWIDDKISA